MNQNTGNSERMGTSILGMPLGSCMLFQRILLPIYRLTSMFFGNQTYVLSMPELIMIKIFISYRQILHKYANEDVSLGAWFIGLDVEQIDDRSFCCGTPPGYCSLVYAGKSSFVHSCMHVSDVLVLHCTSH